MAEVEGLLGAWSARSFLMASVMKLTVTGRSCGAVRSCDASSLSGALIDSYAALWRESECVHAHES